MQFDQDGLMELSHRKDQTSRSTCFEVLVVKNPITFHESMSLVDLDKRDKLVNHLQMCEYCLPLNSDFHPSVGCLTIRLNISSTPPSMGAI